MPIFGSLGVGSTKGLGFTGRTAPPPFCLTISQNCNQASIQPLATALGWNGTSELIVCNTACITSNSTAIPAFCTGSGPFPNGLKLINSGTIVGMGGNGGNATNVCLRPSSTGCTGFPGFPGGAAMRIGAPITICNLGTIAGGGGGGGAGGPSGCWCCYVVPGTDDSGFFPPPAAQPTGAFGGAGGGGQSGCFPSSGGIGCSCTSANINSCGYSGGLGTFTCAGAGGLRCWNGQVNTNTNGAGGTGGIWGSAGCCGCAPTSVACAPIYPGGIGGAAGAAVQLCGFTVTWAATGTRCGTIS